jgi:hypothetical protein
MQQSIQSPHFNPISHSSFSAEWVNSYFVSLGRSNPDFSKTYVGLLENKELLLFDKKRCFCAVANDLGGTAAGELANWIFSKTAVRAFQPANDSANY